MIAGALNFLSRSLRMIALQWFYKNQNLWTTLNVPFKYILVCHFLFGDHK
jgi:hypothetical protein